MSEAPAGAGYGEILALPGVRRLLATSLFARLPLGMSLLGIVLFTRQETGSFALAGLAGGTFTLAGAGIGPVLGALVDRHGQRRVLLPTAVVQSALFAVLVVAGLEHAPGVALVLLAGAAGLSLPPPLAAAIRVLWPAVVHQPIERERAYALDAISQEVIWTAGPLGVSAAVALASPAAAVVLSAAITLVGTLVYLTSPIVLAWQGRDTPRQGRGALASKGLPLLLVSIALSGIAIGAVELGLPALAVHLGSPAASGLMLACWGLGSMGGGVWYARRQWTIRLGRRYAVALGACVATTLPLLAVRGSLPLAVALSLVAGVSWAPIHSCQFALVGKIALPGTSAEAFTWLMAALVGGIAGGAAAAGPLVAAWGVDTAFALSAVLAAAAASVVLANRFEVLSPVYSTINAGL